MQLRNVQPADADVFFEHQKDPVATHMAAFTPEDPADRAVFDQRWARILADDDITKRTIVQDGEVVGSVMGFTRDGDREVTYWIGREHWGKGIATAALGEFLGLEKARPVYARVAKDNIASRRVLEKCGFRICGEDTGFAHARGEETEEFLLKLER